MLIVMKDVAAVLFVTVVVSVYQLCQSQTTITAEVAFVGQSVILTCKFNKTDGFMWYPTSDGGTSLTSISIPSSSNGLIASSPTVNGYVLTIVSTSINNAGQYGLGHNTGPLSCIVCLAVIDVVIAVTTPSDVIVGGDNVTVTCNLTVASRTVVALMRVSVPVDVTISDNNGTVWNVSTSSSNVLVKLNARVPYSVRNIQYLCTARHNSSDISKQVKTLSFQVAYAVQNISLDVSNGSSLAIDDVISCSADGYPAASTFQWTYYANNSQLPTVLTGNGPNFTVNSMGNWTLRCTAFNIILNVTHNATSSVVYFEVSSTIRKTPPSRISKLPLDDGSSKNSSSVNIGVGVGIAVGCCFIIVILAIVYMMKKRRQKRLHSRNSHKQILDGSNDQSNGDGFTPGGVVNRASEFDGITLIDNTTLYGQIPRDACDKQDVKADHGREVTKNDYDESHLYAEVCNSMVGKLNTTVEHPTTSKPATHLQPPVPNSQSQTTTATNSSSTTDLTLVENDIYGKSKLPQQTLQYSDFNAYETLDDATATATYSNL